MGLGFGLGWKQEKRNPGGKIPKSQGDKTFQRFF